MNYSPATSIVIRVFFSAFLSLITALPTDIWSANTRPSCHQLTEELTIPGPKIAKKKYIHAAGDLEIEKKRLIDQANMLRADIWRNVKFSSFDIDPALPFLEVGAGVGGQSPHLLSLLPAQSKLIGIDFDPEQIARAEKNIAHDYPSLNHRILFQTMDAAQMRFGDESMSGAYVSWVLEHMPNYEALSVLKEVRRVVKKNGVIIINEVDLDVGRSWVIEPANSSVIVAPFSKRFIEAMMAQQKESLGNPTVGSLENMRELLKHAGLVDYKYKRLIMHYSDKNPEQLQAYALYLIALWRRVLPDLIKSKRFSAEDFRFVMQEVLTAKILHQEAGQVIVTVH